MPGNVFGVALPSFGGSRRGIFLFLGGGGSGVELFEHGVQELIEFVGGHAVVGAISSMISVSERE